MEIGVALRPDLTGHGEGRSFLACVLQSAQRLYALEKFTLRVTAFDDRARRLYEAVGFSQAGRVSCSVYGQDTDFICMQMPAAAFLEKS